MQNFSLSFGRMKVIPTLVLILTTLIAFYFTLLILFSHSSSVPNNNAMQIIDSKYTSILSYTEKIQQEIENLRQEHEKPTVINHGNGKKLENLVVAVKEGKSLPTKQSVSNSIDPDFENWKLKIERKLLCTDQRKMSFYLYHVRKAAGTTIREIMKDSLQRHHAPLLETEGLVLHSDLLEFPHVFTVTSLRDPITRILSLYWYEHVGWHHGILRQTHKCRSLKHWVDAWKDGTAFKTDFIKKNPKNNYVEIENYYVKAFSGWNGQHPLSEEDLNKAKLALQRFDFVLISEWLGDETQIDALNAVFSGRGSVSAGVKVKGDKKVQDTLRPLLAADEVGYLIIYIRYVIIFMISLGGSQEDFNFH
jgi:hypothetical protein